MNPEVTPEKLQQLWSDPVNWKFGMLYNCATDPRVIVLKKSGLGWTINFARASAFPVLVLSGVLISIPLIFLVMHGYAGTWVWWITIAVSFLIVSLLCRHFASPSRFKR